MVRVLRDQPGRQVAGVLEAVERVQERRLEQERVVVVGVLPERLGEGLLGLGDVLGLSPRGARLLEQDLGERHTALDVALVAAERLAVVLD